MRLFLLVAAVLAGWFYVDRRAWVAEPASGGPFVESVGGCDLPLPSDDAALVFASYYDGAAVSDVRLEPGVQSDETTTLEVRIARGSRPIYLVVAGARHNILRFTGWTARLERVVLVTGTKYPTAATGLPKDLVTFAQREACGPRLDGLYDAPPGADLSFVADVVKRPFPASMPSELRAQQKTRWQMPDAIGGGYDPWQLTISDNSVTPSIYEGQDKALSIPDWFKVADADRFYPGGLEQIDLEQLIAPVAASPYKLLPSRAGIAQLVREGKLVAQGADTFLVKEPIDAPEGLYGAQSVTFVVAPGVPAPTGDLGHSKVR